jgi:hypothetical protein
MAAPFPDPTPTTTHTGFAMRIPLAADELRGTP